MTDTRLPKVTFRPIQKWSSPEAQEFYSALLDKADQAAKAAAAPYLEAATRLANQHMSFDYVVSEWLVPSELLAGLTFLEKPKE